MTKPITIISFDNPGDPHWLVGGRKKRTIEQIRRDVRERFAEQRALALTARSTSTKGVKYSPEQERDDRGRWTEEGFAPSGPEYDDTPAQASAVPPPQEPSSKQVSALANIEPVLRPRTAERCIVYDSDGIPLFDREGSVSSVQFTKDDMEKLKGVPNLVITHNHPGGRSLSIDDVVLATRMNAQEIRAVGRNEGHDVLYRISRGSNAQWPTSQDLVSEFSDADKKQLEKFGPMVREGKIRIPDANFLHGHEVWQAAAKALGLKYERVYDDPYPVVRVNA